VYVRREGHAPPDAQDLTQDFFARLLRLKSLAAVAPHKGKFRTYLLASLKHFLLNARAAASAVKRGGGQTVISLDTLEAEQRYQLEPLIVHFRCLLRAGRAVAQGRLRSSRRLLAPFITRISAASCIAISSRGTSCSTRMANRTSPTSVSPSGWNPRRTSQ
jgi:hypothetical protein